MKRLIRRTVLVLGGLALMLALFCLEENVRGRRAWEAWKASQEACGQDYDPASLVPPAVPAGQNFAEAAFLRLGREAQDRWYERWQALVQPGPGDWKRRVPEDFAPVDRPPGSLGRQRSRPADPA